jgi:hypothetical protein
MESERDPKWVQWILWRAVTTSECWVFAGEIMVYLCAVKPRKTTFLISTIILFQTPHPCTPHTMKREAKGEANRIHHLLVLHPGDEGWGSPAMKKVVAKWFYILTWPGSPSIPRTLLLSPILAQQKMCSGPRGTQEKWEKYLSTREGGTDRALNE